MRPAQPRCLQEPQGERFSKLRLAAVCWCAPIARLMLRTWRRHPVYRAAAVPERCTCSLSSGQSSNRGYSPLQAASLTFPPETTGRPYEPVQQQSLPATEKVGVLLLNLGGPDTLQDVQPFLYNLFVDDSIIRLPPYGEAC